MTSVQKLFAEIDNIDTQGIGEVFREGEEHSLKIPFSLPGEIIEYVNDDMGNAIFLNFKAASTKIWYPLA